MRQAISYKSFPIFAHCNADREAEADHNHLDCRHNSRFLEVLEEEEEVGPYDIRSLTEEDGNH